jgi:hypothetical protein
MGLRRKASAALKSAVFTGFLIGWCNLCGVKTVALVNAASNCQAWRKLALHSGAGHGII